MSDILQLTGLIAPPPGFRSDFKPLLGGPLLPRWSLDQIKSIAASGRLDGRKRYGSKFVCQQRHNNCAGASASRVLAKTVYDRTKVALDLSDTYIYSHINGGRDQGAMLADAWREMESKGCCTAELCGPDDIYRSQYQTQRADAEAMRFRLRECYAIRDEDKEAQRVFWTALAAGFKIGVAVQAGPRFDRLDGDGICGTEHGGGNHAVECDGLTLINGDLYATGENTWSKRWGVQGRMLLHWGHFRETVGVHEFYAARTAIDDPMGQRPPEVKT